MTGKSFFRVHWWLLALALFTAMPRDIGANMQCNSSSNRQAACPESAFSTSDQFLLAVARGDLSRARQLKATGVDINYRSTTPAVVVRTQVRADMTRPFMGGKKRYQFASGAALDIALSRYDTGTARWLLQQGANPAAGYFANIINNTHFAGSYPDSYLRLPFSERARIVAAGYVMEMAVRDNNNVAFSKLLALEPRAIHYRGNVLLDNAMRLGKWQIANQILDKGSDVHALSGFDQLFETVLRSEPTQYSLLQKLLDHARKRKAFRFEHLVNKAIDKQDAQALTMMINSGADLNDVRGTAPLLKTLNSDDVRMAKTLLQLGADPNVRYSGESLLKRAIRHEKPEFVKLLLAKGAHIDDPRQRGETALQLAMSKDDLQYTRMLISAGANINQAGQYGRTPLIQAVEQVRPELVQLLLASGAKANTTDQNVQSALHIATRKADTRLMSLLLGSGANANIRNRSKQTPLHIAVGNKNEKIVQLLLQRHANINLADASGETPLHLAVLNQNLPITRQLLNAGAQPNTTDRGGSTPLLDALNWRRPQIARLLIQHGAKLNVVSNGRETPLDVANKRGLRDLARLIKQKGGLTANEMGANPEHYRVRQLR